MQAEKPSIFCSDCPWHLRNIDKGFAKVKSAIRNLLELPDRFFL